MTTEVSLKGWGHRRTFQARVENIAHTWDKRMYWSRWRSRLDFSLDSGEYRG